MIVKMKKVTLIVSDKYRDSALKKLRKLGVLHVKNINAPASEDIQTLETKIENANKVLQIIGESDEQKIITDLEHIETQVNQIVSIKQDEENLQRELDEQLEIHSWFKKWGAISLESIEKLKQAGVFIRFYVADKSTIKNLPQAKIIHIAKEEHGRVYLAFFSESADEKLDLKEDPIPTIELVELEKNISQLSDEINIINDSIKAFSDISDGVLKYKTDLENRLQLNRVKYGMGEEGDISYLQGFCPVDTVPKVKKLAEEDGWGYLIQDPDAPNEVPTLIKNPKWIRIIEPLFNFMGTLPGYNEQDVSFVFLVFFSIFFAMIVGDAGYGFIFLISTFIFARKKKEVENGDHKD